MSAPTLAARRKFGLTFYGGTTIVSACLTTLSRWHEFGSSKKDLMGFPDEVRDEVGYALYIAQRGGKHESVKPLKGFGGAGVLEDHRGDTYRAVYTVRYATAVYVLHAFQKKSKRGAETPKEEIDLIREQLKTAERDHEARESQR